MAGCILVINPNSNSAVTDGISSAVEPLRVGGVSIECATLANAPFGIQTQADVEAVVLPLRDLVASRNNVDAFVIACFSDPGLEVCREVSAVPVLGIRECAVMSALMQGDRFGVLALGPASIKRHTRAFRQMGVAERCAGCAPLNLSVEAAEEAEAFPRVLEVGRDLVERGADSLILGCAGMGRHVMPLQDALGVPVVDPTMAATAHALGLVLMSRSRSAAAQQAA